MSPCFSWPGTRRIRGVGASSGLQKAYLFEGLGWATLRQHVLLEDLSDEVILLVANYMEAMNLRQVKEMEAKHINIAMAALETNLKLKLEGVPFTEPESDNA